MKMKRYSILAVALAALASSVFFYTYNSTVQLVIVHTNDHHGYCWAENNAGGFAKEMTLLKKIRAENKNVLLLSAGDINSGAPESDLNRAEPSFKGMNLLKFDAMAVGNHEFDNSLPLLREQEAWSTFPFLTANVYDKTEQKRLFTPYITKEVSGLKIGIFGLTTSDTAFITDPKNVQSIEFKDHIEEGKKVVAELKNNNVPFVIALTHIGYYANEQHAPNAPGDITLAKSSPAINVIVGGHTDSLLEQPDKVNNTLIVQANRAAKYMGELKLKIRKRNGEILQSEFILHKLDEAIPEDPEMVAFLSPYLERAKKLTLEPVGVAELPLDGVRENVRRRETNLGNLVTDVYREIARADVAIQNGGGIRAPIDAGEITFGEILGAFPFNNTVVSVELTGAELLSILERSASLPRDGTAGGFLQISGAKVLIKGNKVVKVDINGKPLDPKKKYTVATNSFTANGGDGYELLKDKPRLDTGYTIASTLKRHIAAKKAVSPRVEGRIVIY